LWRCSLSLDDRFALDSAHSETTDSVRVLRALSFEPVHVLGTPSGVGVVFLLVCGLHHRRNVFRVTHSRTICLFLGRFVRAHYRYAYGYFCFRLLLSSPLLVKPRVGRLECKIILIMGSVCCLHHVQRFHLRWICSVASNDLQCPPRIHLHRNRESGSYQRSLVL
jgi:hypothetical protein